jgi:hypothetical protein
MNIIGQYLLSMSTMMLAGVAALNILYAWWGSDTIRLARLIEAGSTSGSRYADENVILDYKFLDEFMRTSDFKRLARSCGDDLSRSTLTIRLASLESVRRQQHAAQLPDEPHSSEPASINLPAGATNEIFAPTETMTEKPRPAVFDQKELDWRSLAARQAIEERLFCAPTDGNAWLQRARLDFLAGDYSAAIVGARLSQAFAPAEKWVLQPRFEIVSQIVESGDRTLSREFSADLQRIVRNVPANEIAITYENAGENVRHALGEEIHALEDRRKMQVLSAVDRLGYVIPKTR